LFSFIQSVIIVKMSIVSVNNRRTRKRGERKIEARERGRERRGGGLR